MSRPLRIEVAHGDVTTADVDVLVNASNTTAWLGSGVSGAISRACGPGFQEAITAALQRQYGTAMAPGDVLVTDAGAHPRARYIAHVAVMDYRPDHVAKPDAARIRAGCEHLWAALEQLPEPALSVAMVALGAGTGGMGVRAPTEIACETLTAHRAARGDSRIERVVFYGWELHEYANIAHVVRARLGLEDDQLPADLRAFLATIDPSA